MNTKHISIRNIVLGIIAIAIGICIGITIGISISRADVARVSLEKGRDLGLQSALYKADLRADLDTRLKSDSLLEVASLGRLGAKDLKFNSLNGRLLG
jgi:hypothetical protein